MAPLPFALKLVFQEKVLTKKQEKHLPCTEKVCWQKNELTRLCTISSCRVAYWRTSIDNKELSVWSVCGAVQECVICVHLWTSKPHAPGNETRDNIIALMLAQNNW